MRGLAGLIAVVALAAPSTGLAQLASDSFGNVSALTSYDYVALDGSGSFAGTPLSLQANSQADITLPWSFPFYGGTYTVVSVSANGALRFQPGALVASVNQPIPSATGAIPDVAVFWDFLDPGAGGNVYWHHDSAADRVIISWEDVPHFGGIGDASFQVQLTSDGGMRFFWNDTWFGNAIYDSGASASVGIQDVVGGTWANGNALEFSFDSSQVPNGLALYIGACAGDVDEDGFVSNLCGGLDCDDFDNALNPLATEVCADGIDQDCDGGDLPLDADGDTYDASACGGPDCDDADASISPAAAEVCNDGIDNDCASATPDLIDVDGDGSTCDLDCDDGDATVFPGAPEVCDDTVDQDCDGLDVDSDVDGDTFLSLACGGDDCDDSDAGVNASVDADSDGYDACADCDDADAAVNPAALEVCDSVDGDCDGLDDSVDLDIGGSTAVTNAYAASTPMGFDGTVTGNTTFSQSQTVSGSIGDIVDLDVQVEIYHAAPEQLEISVTSPSGTTVLLKAAGLGTGSGGAGLGVPVFDDEALISVATATPPFGGPVQPSGLLSDVDGEDGNGSWTITIVDDTPAVEDGHIQSWQLNMTTQVGDDLDQDGYVDSCGDCDSTDAAINPGAQEVCGDGIDQDCDGSDLASDADGDGFDDVACGGGDCNDASAAINPNVAEACNDGVDNDCDPSSLDLFDADGDGSDCAADCDDGNAFIAPGIAEVCGDGVDNDCDSTTIDLFDGDGDGSDCASDCNDGDNGVYPGAPELFCSGVDEDCDTATSDLGDGDGDGSLCDADCDDSDPLVYPGALEFVCDGVDQACDGLGSEVDNDGDGVPQCQADCDDADPTIYPGAPELCGDGIDQDCDGDIDEPASGTYTLDDDGAVTFEICSFSFPFCGESFDSLTLQSNGRLTFGDSGGLGFDDGSGADPASTGSVSDLTGEAPQIAFLWSDLDPEIGGSITVLENASAGTFAVSLTSISQSTSWSNASAGPNTATLTLSSVGVATLDYGYLSANVALVGWACDASNVAVVDLDDPDQPATAPRVGAGTEDALYEHFQGAANGDEDVDLANTTVELCLTAGADNDGDGWTDLCGDCDDTNAFVFPGATELCDGLDHDCDNDIDDADDDEDGYISTACGGPDCDDGEANVNPAQLEACDGLDNDCDGSPETGGEDQDADGWLVCDGDCDDGDALINPDGEEICNEADDDCDGSVDEGWNRDQDADGTVNPDCGGDDCDDLDSDVSPIEVETCDGKDNDCNGEIDDVDADGDGFFSAECGGDDCNDLRASTWPGAPEACDGNDTDCNGVVNDVDLDADGGLDANCGGDDCHDGDPNVFLGAVEICDDGVDNDCDGGTDQGGGDTVADPDCTGGCDCNASPDGRPAPLLFLLPLLLLVRRRT